METSLPTPMTARVKLLIYQRVDGNLPRAPWRCVIGQCLMTGAEECGPGIASEQRTAEPFSAGSKRLASAGQQQQLGFLKELTRPGYD